MIPMPMDPISTSAAVPGSPMPSKDGTLSEPLEVQHQGKRDREGDLLSVKVPLLRLGLDPAIGQLEAY